MDERRTADNGIVEGFGPAPEGFEWSVEPWGRALRSRGLAPIADHFFTSLPLRFRGDDGEEARDWALAAESIAVSPDRLLRLDQIHGRDVFVVHKDRPLARPAGAPWPQADILISNDPRFALAVQVADCVPLLVADPESGAVAAAHAGWRGTALGVAGAAVAALAREFGSRPADLVVAHGPSIGPCCYVVGKELPAEFARQGLAEDVARWFSGNGNDRLRLDLWSANRDQLLRAGVRAEHLYLCNLCTSSHPQLFPSYRRDGKGTGRIAAVIRARG